VHYACRLQDTLSSEVLIDGETGVSNGVSYQCFSTQFPVARKNTYDKVAMSALDLMAEVP
jgi:hypothetical protein